MHPNLSGPSLILRLYHWWSMGWTPTTCRLWNWSYALKASSPGDLTNPEIKPRSPTLQADSLPADPPGKPKNTGVGCLFLLQQIHLGSPALRGGFFTNWALRDPFLKKMSKNILRTGGLSEVSPWPTKVAYSEGGSNTSSTQMPWCVK